MNHRPFEDWLLNQDPLTPAQKRELQEHLQTCSSCSALVEVDLALKSVRQVAPAEGFVDRFQIRLAAQRKMLKRRNTIGFFILTLCVIAILTWVAWPVLRGVFESPSAFLASWLSYFVSLWTSIQAMGHVSELFLRIVPGFVSPAVWMIVLLGAGGWCLVWMLSLMKITKIPQGV
jgi:hypothetical protein